MIDETMILEAARRLVAAAPGSEVVLFGSHARGDAHGRSDLDLLVISPQVENTTAESVRLRRELRGMGLAVDLVVMRRRDVEGWRDARGSFVRAALSEGRSRLMASGRDLARDLLASADDDAAAARVANDVSDAMVGFHSQQAVGKAHTATLALRGVEFPFTHDLAALVELKEKAGMALPESLADVDRLTPFGVRLRSSAAEDDVLVPRETGVIWMEHATDWAHRLLDDPGLRALEGQRSARPPLVPQLRSSWRRRRQRRRIPGPRIRPGTPPASGCPRPTR